MEVPTHIISGDEDNNCLEPGIFIKRACPAARLTVVPGTGHAVNVEEPDLFNRLTDEFLSLVDSGRWRPRDSRAQSKSTKNS
jgi:pimeloyl-ACP methyl ester carboxylesterase